ncbi:MAG: PAS domain-containing sensor histidine kinase [Armatimonadota bacterium]
MDARCERILPWAVSAKGDRRPWTAAWTIPAVYLGMGSLWLAISERLPPLVAYSDSPWGFLLFLVVTGAILHGLLRRQVAPLQRAETERRHYEMLFHNFVETTQEGVWVQDRQGRTLYVNPRMTTLLGYTPDEMFDRPLTDFVAPEKRKEAEQHQTLLNDGTAEIFELPLRRKDGDQICALIASNPIFDRHDHLIGELAMVTDITAQRRTEEQLREVNRELRVLTNADQALVRATAEDELLQRVTRIIVEQGKYLLAWVDYPDTPLRRVAQAGAAEGLPDALQHFAERALRTRAPVVMQDIAADPDIPRDAARPEHAALIALPLVADGPVLGVLTIVAGEPNTIDPTEVALLTELADDMAYGITAIRTRQARRQAEEELKYERALLTSAIDTLPLPILLFRSDGSIFRTNHAVGEFFRGMPVDNVWDLELLTADTHVSVQREQRPSSQALQGNMSRSVEYILGLPDGSQTPVLVHAAPTCVEGTLVAGVVALQDITALKEADRAKNRFLAMLTHEMRTPLTNILGWVGQAREMPEIVPDALHIIERNAKQQHEMLEDLLDVSRLLLGRLTIKPTPADLWELAQHSISRLEDDAAAGRLRLVLVPPPEPLPVEADGKRIRHAIGDLVRNAMQHTDPGGTITVSARRDGDRVSISVADTGHGIAPELLPTLFAPFRQIERREEIGGLGLGLLLTKGIVELHGGRVTAYSAGRGKGSTFTIELPRRMDEKSE